ncbi:MAG: hypothetical protein CM15mP22_6120 [Gammaproteobacteria bacterium]|nr:MAG: hypothetical protein CM15mP22_6120 [Gammaproteobacteria bacterium]
MPPNGLKREHRSFCPKDKKIKEQCSYIPESFEGYNLHLLQSGIYGEVFSNDLNEKSQNELYIDRDIMVLQKPN